MEKKLKLNKIFNELADELNISDTDYDRAVRGYTALGKFIKEHNQDWDVIVYPQGSFELGTVVKPVNENDQYDVDLVVQVITPDFGAEEIRKKITHLLESYGRYEERVEEKKPCLRITYSDSAQFHMDLACAKPKFAGQNFIIKIARKYDDGSFNYEDSNPLGYIEWFKKAMSFERLLQEHKFFASRGETQVKTLTLSKAKLPLQKAIQILKRHRDIYFQNDLDSRPSSIIITTLCALAYDSPATYKSFSEQLSVSDEANVYLIIKGMLERFPLFTSNNSAFEYVLDNPSLPGENFLRKWNEQPKLKVAFDKWYRQAQIDIIENPVNFIEDDPKRLRDSMHASFGKSSAESVLRKYGEAMRLVNTANKLNIDKTTMSTTFSQNTKEVVTPEKNTYYGD